MQMSAISTVRENGFYKQTIVRTSRISGTLTGWKASS